MTLTSLDFWRLADDLSVIDAAILITGNDPSGRVEVEDADGRYNRGPNGEWETRKKTDYAGFEAVFKGLRGAILTNRLRANIRHEVRKAEYEKVPDYDRGINHYIPQYLGPNHQHTTFDFLIARHGPEHSIDARSSLNFSVEELRGTDDYFIWKEPDWANTTISVDDLKQWLEPRGIFPPFFFPKGNQEGFRNKSNPRYAPKLAACVAAWEAVQAPARKSNVKQTLKDWLQSNAASFGVGDEGIVSDTMAEELAKIVNWNPSGGATPTAGNDQPAPPKMPQPVENYPFGYDTKKNRGIGKENSSDDDMDSIPF